MTVLSLSANLKNISADKAVALLQTPGFNANGHTISIRDTISNIAKNVEVLNTGLPVIASIYVTGPATVIPVGYDSFLKYQGLVDRITSGSKSLLSLAVTEVPLNAVPGILADTHITSITVLASPDELLGNIGDLPKVAAYALNADAVGLTVAQTLAIEQIPGFTSDGYTLSITDSVGNVLNNLDALNRYRFDIGSIRFTDENPAISLSSTQFKDIQGLLSRFQGLPGLDFTVSVSDVGASDERLLSNYYVSQATVLDSANALLLRHSHANVTAYKLKSDAEGMTVSNVQALVDLPGFDRNGHTISVTDSVAHIQGLLTTLGVSGYTVLDTLKNITIPNSVIAAARTVIVSDTAENLLSQPVNAQWNYQLSQNATGLSLAQIDKLKSLHGFSLNGYIYSVSDTIANLERYKTSLNKSLDYVISDTGAHILSAIKRDPQLFKNACSVEITDVDVTLTGKEALALKSVPGSIKENFYTLVLAHNANPTHASLDKSVGASDPAASKTNLLHLLEDAANLFIKQLAQEKVPLLGVLGSDVQDLVTQVDSRIKQMVNTPASAATVNKLQPGSDFSFDIYTGSFDLSLKSLLNLANLPVENDLGVTGLGIDVSGKLAANLGYDLELHGGYDASNGGFYLNETGKNATSFSAMLGINGSNLSLKGTLGPLQITATDKPSNTSFDPALKGKSTGASVDLFLGLKPDEDALLTESDMNALISGAKSLNDVINLSVSGSAQLSLGIHAAMDLGSSTAGKLATGLLPDYSFDFAAPLSISYTTSSNSITTKAGDVYIDDATLGFGAFVKDFLSPAIHTAEAVVSPLFPLVNFLMDPLPIKGTTYQFNESGWKWYDYLNPLGKLAKEGSKVLISNSIDSAIKSAYAGLDYNGDRVVDAIEIPQSLLHDFKTIINNPTVVSVLQGAGINLSDQQLAQYQTLADTLVISIDLAVQGLQAIQKFEQITVSLAQAEKQGLSTVGWNMGDYAYSLDSDPAAIARTANLNALPDVLSTNATAKANQQNFLTSNPVIAKLLNDLDEVGVQLPILTDGTSLSKILFGKPADLLTYTPDIPDVQLNLNLPIPILNLLDLVVPGASAAIKALPFDLGLNFEGVFALQSNLTFGVDTQGLIDWSKSGLVPAKAYELANGLYVADYHPNAYGITSDLPELSLDYDAQIKGYVSDKLPGLDLNGSLYTGIRGDINLDLNTTAGKLRGSDIVTNLDKPWNLFNINGNLDYFVGAGLSAGINLGEFGAIASQYVGQIPILGDLAEIARDALPSYTLELPSSEAVWKLIGVQPGQGLALA